MTTWFSSDTHLGHINIITLCDRPYRNVDDMNESLIANWNSVVAPGDTVYHLGDLALGKFGESIKLVARLNGHKTLIVGNHDRLFVDPNAKRMDKHARAADRFRPMYQEVFENIVEGSVAAAAELLLIPEIKVDLSTGQNRSSSVLRLSHFPYGTVDSHAEARFATIRPKDDGKVLIHGHSHSPNKISRSANGTLMVHVGVDAWSGFPVSLEQVMQLIKDNQ